MNKLVCTNSENKNHLLHLTLNLIVVKILSFFDVDFNKSLYVSQRRFPVDHCLPHCFESKGRFQTKFQRTFYIIWPSDGQLDLLGNTALAKNGV